MNPMIPGIAIDHKEFIVVLYDCVNDILLTTDRVPNRKKKEGIIIVDGGVFLY